MKLYSNEESYKLYQGNMLDLETSIKPNSIDSIVTDPPYELSFMNKGWDASGVAFQKETWQHCLNVLKPGGYLLAFGGSRTFYRIACAIEDAGFEIRDVIMWLYGSGFPKSMNISLSIDKMQGLQGQRGVGGFNVGGIGEQQNRKSKLYIGSTTDGSKQEAYTDFKIDEAKKWAGWGTALKPSYEPIIVARKPVEGSITSNVLKHGVGGINIDECRVGVEGGRFPANTILTYDETDRNEVCSGFPEGGKNGSISKRYKMNNQVYGEYGECNTWEAYNDSGSAARYFYCAKATTKDREEGCEALETKTFHRVNSGGLENDERFKPLQRKNIHPTVKPTELMQYLIRLVTPNGGTVLDPFNGSGSTGKAVMYENKERDKGYKYIGIELTEEYLPIAKARIEHVLDIKPVKDGQMTIFDFMGV